jgi:putative thioredoxin
MYNATSTTFQNDVIDASGTEPVVVMFHASWCGPCRGMKPLVDALAAEQGFKLVGVDAGENRDLAAQYNVRAVPTLAVFKDGALVTAVAGGLTIDRLRSFLAAAGVPANTKE